MTKATRRGVSRWATLGLAAAALLGAPGAARACGGLFCNGGPPNPFAPLPIAQNGENVVFAITKDPGGGAPSLEAHIQILYAGDAAKFSWVVPVDAEPTLGTGTDLLFSALAGVTTPQFRMSYQVSGTCIQPPSFPERGVAGTAAPGGNFNGAPDNGTVLQPPSVQVSFQGAVGPFDAAVIKSDDSTALKKWLVDNSYVVTDQASGLIDTYVAENKYFVALKLLNGVGVKEIQPIVLKFRGPEACVPLRLTAIAANPDMPVLVWVLGDSRVAPRGYLELQIDDARVDWLSSGSNYFGGNGLVSKAANEAGGNAFITEYAGPASVAAGLVFRNGQIDVEKLKTAMTPPAYVQLLVQMGLASDPIMLGLLGKYIPMPDALKKMNVTDVQFYGQIQMYWNTFAFPPFDLEGLTDAIATSIVKPRLAAQMMIDSHAKLTRLNTFISPEEMTKDPFFFEAKDLPDVSNVHTATLRVLCGDGQYLECNAPWRLELKDGRMVWLRAGSKSSSCTGDSADRKDFEALPAASVAWVREPEGEGVAMVDNRAAITAALDAHNARLAAAMAGPTGGGLTGPSTAGGCGCAVAGGGGGLAVAGLALELALARRRRAR
jgi:hypothetical protein